MTAPSTPRTPPPARRLSIIVPVYNEIGTVHEALTAILAKEIQGMETEVIIIESNSTDGSRAVVESFAAHPKARIILEGRPSGKGLAVRKGLAVATGEIILIQDADLEYDLNDYEILLQPIRDGRFTFVLGKRHSHDDWRIRTFEKQPLRAFLLNTAHWGFTTLINISLFTRLSDPFTMYKVFRRECLEGLTFSCNRFDFDWELLIKLVRAGHRPVEIPINYRSRSFAEGKKIRIFRDPLTWIVAWAKSRFGPLR